MVINDVAKLVANFYRDIELAKELLSSNPEDDLAIKMAVVGFSYNAPTSEWGYSHFEFVKRRLQNDAPSDWFGESSGNVQLFTALSLGYLLGLFEQGKLSESEFRLAEIQLPGVVMLHLPTITARSAT